MIRMSVVQTLVFIISQAQTVLPAKLDAAWIQVVELLNVMEIIVIGGVMDNV